MFSKNVNLTNSDSTYLLVDDDQGLKALHKKYRGYLHVEIREPAENGTDEQNRAMHGLLQTYWLTHCHSYQGTSFDEFKSWMKSKYGVAYDMTIKGEKIRVLESWSKYSKKQRASFITDLIAEIHEAGAHTDPKIQEILQRMADNSLLKGGHG